MFQILWILFPKPAAVFRHRSSISGPSSLSPTIWLAALQATMHPSQDDPGHCHPSPLSSNPCVALWSLHTASATWVHCRKMRTKGAASLQQQHMAAPCCPWKEAVALLVTAPNPAGLNMRCWPTPSSRMDEGMPAPFSPCLLPRALFVPSPHFTLPFDLSDSLVYLL